VADLVGSDTLYFRVPPIAQDTRALSINPDQSYLDDPNYGLVNLTYCVSAIDMYNAITPKCADLAYLQNKMSFLQDYTQLVNYVSTLSFGKNITNILYAANIIFQSI
jgi:hypothetical protein